MDRSREFAVRRSRKEARRRQGPNPQNGPQKNSHINTKETRLCPSRHGDN